MSKKLYNSVLSMVQDTAKGEKVPKLLMTESAAINW